MNVFIQYVRGEVTDLESYNDIIQTWDSFKYLGATTDERCRDSTDIKQRIGPKSNNNKNVK